MNSRNGCAEITFESWFTLTASADEGSFIATFICLRDWCIITLTFCTLVINVQSVVTELKELDFFSSFCAIISLANGFVGTQVRLKIKYSSVFTSYLERFYRYHFSNRSSYSSYLDPKFIVVICIRTFKLIFGKAIRISSIRITFVRCLVLRFII